MHEAFLMKISFILYVLKPDDCHAISCEQKVTTSIVTSQHFKRHKLLDCLHTIYANVSGALTESQQCELESMDKVQVDGSMKYMENKCRRLAMGHVEYSP
jgi:hypothetical protein